MRPSDRGRYLIERAHIGLSCWTWLLSVGSHGYGNAFDGTTVVLAHRLAYETWVGPIPEAMTVDHVCHNRRCINPQHLRLLTNVENARDNGMATRTECPAGHPYSDENTYVNPRTSHRQCRQCDRDGQRRRYRQSKAKAS